MTFGNPIMGSEELIRDAIRSSNYVAGVSGWRIARDGVAELRGVVASGSLYTTDGTVYAKIEAGRVTVGEVADANTYAFFRNGEIQFTDDNTNFAFLLYLSNNLLVSAPGDIGVRSLLKRNTLASGMEQWTTLSYSGSWGTYNSLPVQYMRDPMGFVHMRGQATRAGAADGEVVGVLPTGYRPTRAHEFVCSTPAAANWHKFVVDASGNVTEWDMHGMPRVCADTITFCVY